ncbi:MAG TPA: CsbD family protein [Blastocatellia bacterium]|nr:CsbD family protein [Blastocatellia bacterium]
MGIPNKDEVKGKVNRVKGEVKERIGRATNDPDLIQRSQDDKAAGRAQETFGKARRKVGDAVKDVGEAIRK